MRSAAHEFSLQYALPLHTLACLFLMTAVLTANAAESEQKRWIQGSWVNLRAAPSGKAEVVGQLTANTEISLLADQGQWCEIATTTPTLRGFMVCRLLGAQPLALAEVGEENVNGLAPTRNPKYSPPRAFWLAPSVTRLLAAGSYFWETMLSAQQKRSEAFTYDEGPNNITVFDERHPPKIVRYPVPEFEAMKDLMKNGVIAAPENRPKTIKWKELVKNLAESNVGLIHLSGYWLEEGSLDLLRHGSLGPIKSSLFKHATDLASRPATVEQLGAQFGIGERLRILSGPKWVHFRHDDPRVNGYWDIGSFEVSLEQPVFEYVIGRQGLASARSGAPKQKEDIEADYNCEEGIQFPQHDTTPMAGYPTVKDPLTWIYTPKALAYKKVVIKRYVKRISTPANGKPAPMQSQIGMVVMHEIDIDGDGVADLAVWEGMPAVVFESNGVAVIFVFANIAGEWHLIEATAYTECS